MKYWTKVVYVADGGVCARAWCVCLSTMRIRPPGNRNLYQYGMGKKKLLANFYSNTLTAERQMFSCVALRMQELTLIKLRFCEERGRGRSSPFWACPFYEQLRKKSMDGIERTAVYSVYYTDVVDCKTNFARLIEFARARHGLRGGLEDAFERLRRTARSVNAYEERIDQGEKEQGIK
ncbi:hypothetical protein EVAR_18757_1 [Eumeta japonica]|uniref:Uncharacterized protein n=1 Tax=Eumeta variegata TaxID=151549 RepID=A0A4C1UNL7_EUMVA|nr:hypothetical protein EVAR_18757_1 [Eumeta japonica]